MDRRHGLDTSSVASGAIRKSNSNRRRTRRTSPRWSEEAVRGSCESSLQLPSGGPTLTQEGFNAWLQTQRPEDGNAQSWRMDTPEQAAIIDEWLQLQSREDASTGVGSDSRPLSSCRVSTDNSPITAPEYSYSPSEAFTGMPAVFPTPAGPPTTMPFAADMNQAGFDNNYTLQPPVATPNPPTDLLGIGTFDGSTEFANTLPVTRRPLRYKPLSTWFHLWLV